MKRASRKSKLYVGGFVVIMALLAIGALLFLGNDIAMIKSKSHFTASFKDISGLQVGAPVKMGGVDVGIIDDISILSKAGETTIVTNLTIYGPFDKMIKSDSMVSLETQGVLGDKFVMLTAGTPEAEPIKPGEPIKVNEKLELSAVVAKSVDIVASVGTTTSKLAKIADALPDQVAMKRIFSELAESIHSMRDMLTDLRSEQSMIAALSGGESAKQFNETLQKLASASSHFESVAKKIDGGQGTLGALVNDSSLYDDMRALMGRANRSKAAKLTIRKALESSTGKPSQDENDGDEKEK